MPFKFLKGVNLFFKNFRLRYQTCDTLYQNPLHAIITTAHTHYKCSSTVIWYKLDGEITQDFYIEKRNEYQNSLDELTLKKHSTLVEVDDVMEKANICIELLKNAHDKYLGYDMQKKRYFIKLLVSNFSYDGQNLHANLKSTVKILLESAYSEKWWALEDSNF